MRAARSAATAPWARLQFLPAARSRRAIWSSTLTVNGNLVFAAASLYMVEVQGNTADRTNASGTATLAGTVGAVNLGGIPVHSYTILSAAAGRIGTFDSVTALNLPAFLTASLAYTS